MCELVPGGMIFPLTNKNYHMKLPVIAVVSLVPFLAFVPSCKEKGPAEETGEKIDNAVEEIKDTVDPKGPMEKAGEKVDDALGE